MVIVINNSDKQVGLYSGGLIFGGGGLYSGGAYIWNEVSVSTCGGLIHGGGLIFGGAYSRRFTVCQRKAESNKVNDVVNVSTT